MTILRIRRHRVVMAAGPGEMRAAMVGVVLGARATTRGVVGLGRGWGVGGARLGRCATTRMRVRLGRRKGPADPG